VSQLKLNHYAIGGSFSGPFLPVRKQFHAKVSQDQLAALEALQIEFQCLKAIIHAGLFAVERTFTKR